MRGFYKDKLTNSNKQIIWESNWNSNLIVRNCNILLASLMKRHEGMHGILYWAVGEGAGDWASQPVRPNLTDSILAKELIRKPIPTSNIGYIDSEGNPTTTPSNQLEITSEFKGEDFSSGGPKQLREFGLFGGNATEEIESGIMINHVIHPRIDITPELTLVRKVYFDFATGAIKPEELTGFGASLPVESIDGVGSKYATILKGLGIETLNDLIKINPLDPIAEIPPVKLREFRAKARMVMGIKVTLAPFNTLTDYSISDILVKNPEELLEIIGLPEVDLEMVVRLQEELALLQIALDNRRLKNIKFGELMKS
jgi:hypothetical protein